MAKAKGEAPKKSGFIREQFAKNPKISLEEMSAAWDALGVVDPSRKPCTTK